MDFLNIILLTDEMSGSPGKGILWWHSTLICNSYKTAIPRAELITGSKQFGGTNLCCNALVGIKEKKSVIGNVSLAFPKIGCCKFHSKSSIRILI